MNRENTDRAPCMGGIQRFRIAGCGVSVGGLGRLLISAALIVCLIAPPSLAGAASYGEPTAVAPQGASVPDVRAPNGGTESSSPSNAEITKPRGSTDALMDAYNRRIQGVMDQAVPLMYVTPEEAFSASNALKNNPEYRKALELYMQLAGEGEAPSGAAVPAGEPDPDGQGDGQPKDALETYEALYEALLARAKAHEDMGSLPNAQDLIEQAMASMAEDGTGVDAAVTELYREIMEKVSGQADSLPSEESAP